MHIKKQVDGGWGRKVMEDVISYQIRESPAGHWHLWIAGFFSPLCAFLFYNMNQTQTSTQLSLFK